MEHTRPIIALVINEMSIGGIPKASIPLMKQLLQYADVHLIQTNETGELQDQIPAGVKTIVAPYQRTRQICSKLMSRGKPLKALFFRVKTLFLGHVSKRWVVNNAYIAKYADLVSDVEYDCAIAFHGMNIDHLTRTLYQVKAKKRIAWIHGDHPFTGKHQKDAAKIYSAFEKILCASGICKRNFVRDFPLLVEKTQVFHCLLEPDIIRKCASEQIDFSYPEDSFNILTVGRISPEKGQRMIPEILRLLRKAEKTIRWYLVGDGPDRPEVENLIKQTGCENLFILGAKVNPYPYIKQCDLYVQPSFSEAYSLTAFEAATLGKPIVLTDVAGATELLRAEEDILVSEPTPESIANQIKRLIENKELRLKLTDNLSDRDFSNNDQISALVAWISE